MELVEQSAQGLVDYTSSQLQTFFPDSHKSDLNAVISRNLDQALSRVEKCINAVQMWPEHKFNHLHSSQYCIYLYYLANTIWRNEADISVCTRLFMLNKLLNGIDLFYEIQMPDIFFIGHSVGIVLSKATYGNYLVLYQNSTVGKNHGVAPVIGEGVVMYPNTAIIGRCHIADNTVLSIGTHIVNQVTPGNCFVFNGEQGALVFKPPTRNVAKDIFRL
jgi:serine O-acetyltransferase